MPLDRSTTDRLPPPYTQLTEAVTAAGWDWRASVAGPMRCGDVVREVVEFIGTTRTGHRVRAWWIADAPPGAARPAFGPGGALVGQGYQMRDAKLAETVEYVRHHPRPRR